MSNQMSKIAVTAQAPSPQAAIDPRFGRAACFIVFDHEGGNPEVHDNKQNLNAAQGAGIQAGQNVAALGVEAVITGNVGPKAFRLLEEAGIKVFRVAGDTVEEALQQWKDGLLPQVDAPTQSGHWT